MHKRSLCRHAVSVCLSVRPSVTFVDHVKTNKHIFEICSPSGSHTILVFPCQTVSQYSDGNPPSGGDKYNGVWKNRDFRPISRCNSEMIQDTAIVTMEGEYETVPKLSNGTVFNNLAWPFQGHFKVISYSRRYCVKTAIYIMKLFSPLGSPTILVLCAPNSLAIFGRGTPWQGEWETVTKLSNGTIFNDLEWPLTQVSRSRYYSTSNNSKMVQYRAILTMADQ